ncbi:hypothetical protein GCM10023405_17060 [Streptomonospora salina]
MSESQSAAAAKPFSISKLEVWQAWEQVGADRGAAGVDSVALGEFEEGLKDNLYKIWNRMSSGSCFPDPVGSIEIAKPGGGARVLGIPTIADRVAQTVAARRLEAAAEPQFHPDSDGFRPGRSAHDAVRTCRKRCWERRWVVDLDIAGFFDAGLGTAHEGGREPRAAGLGWAVCAAVAGRGGRCRRWPDDRAGSGHAAGRAGLAGAGRPVPARCLRQLDVGRNREIWQPDDHCMTTA